MEERIKLDHGGKLFIAWLSESCTLEDIDNWVNYRRVKYFDPEEWMEIDAGIANNSQSTGATGQLVEQSANYFSPFKAPDPKKPIRIRLANVINYIGQIYDTLRKVNFAINLDLKEFKNNCFVFLS